MSSKIDEEKRTVTEMIKLYCRHKEGNKILCSQCAAVMDYALQRLEKCTFQDAKPTCQKCKIHCYKPEMRAKIKDIMRYAGPRMIIYHPIMAIKHIFRNINVTHRTNG